MELKTAPNSENQSPSSPAGRPKRSWKQFSLRGLLVLTTLLAIVCAWIAYARNIAREQREAVAYLEGHGILFNYQADVLNPTDKLKTAEERATQPKWLRQLMSDEYFDRPISIHVARNWKVAVTFDEKYFNELNKLDSIKSIVVFSEDNVGEEYWTKLKKSDSVVDIFYVLVSTTERSLAEIAKFRNLNKLAVHIRSISDEGLKPLENLSQLTSLELQGEGVNDKHVPTLCRLKSLKRLDFLDTSITEQGIDEIKKSLSQCKVQENRTAKPSS